MGKRNTITALCLVLGLFAISGLAFAHGTEKHDKMLADPQMKKLHAMMPMFSITTAKIEAAIEKGDVTSVEVEAGKIVAALPDLKKSKPHKNINQKKKFVEMVTKLETAVNLTVSLAKKGDFTGANTTFKQVEEACAACHAKFRD